MELAKHLIILVCPDKSGWFVSWVTILSPFNNHYTCPLTKRTGQRLRDAGDIQH